MNPIACAMIALVLTVSSEPAHGLPPQSPTAPAAEPAITPAAINDAAMNAYRSKDFSRFLALERRALELEPGTPRLIYNVACGEALLGHPQESVRQLDALLDTRLDLGAETDDDFAKVRNTPEWAAFLQRLHELRKPILRGDIAFRLDDPGLVAAGTAIDAHNGDTYIASIRERKILRRNRTGAVSDFIPSAQNEFLAGASLAIDPARKLLYASTSAAPFMVAYRKEDDGRSGVFAFDLHSGSLARKAMLAADGKTHFLNALTVDRKGTVYVADSAVGEIFLLKPAATELETLVAPGVFRSTQGLALSDDEKTLFVADYLDGVWALDLATKQTRHLEVPANTWLGGLDGLSRVVDGFIAVQIGIQPNRLLRLRMDRAWQRIAAVETIESNRPEFNGPIQGVVDGIAFVYVANSQLSLVDGKTGAFPIERATATIVLRTPIDTPARK